MLGVHVASSVVEAVDILPFVTIALTPAVRMVCSSYDPSTYPPTLGVTTWNSYPAGRPLTAEPVTLQDAAPGNWDWDSLSLVSGSGTRWSR